MRRRIEVGRRRTAGHSIHEIAAALDVSPSTVRNDWRAFQGGGVPAAGDPFEGLEFRGRPVDDAMLMLFEDVFEGRRLNFEQNSRAFGVKPVVGLIQRRMAVKGDFDPGSFRKFLLAYLKYG